MDWRKNKGPKIETIKLHQKVPLSDFVRACVDVPRVSGYCSACENFGTNWSCPPFENPPASIWASYDSLLLYGVKIITPAADLEQAYDPKTLQQKYEGLLALPRETLHKELLGLEQGLPGSMALFAGSCVLCGDMACTRASGKPCRHPETMRTSIEALGGDVSLCLERYFGEHLLWAQAGRLPPSFILLGGLLTKATVPQF